MVFRFPDIAAFSAALEGAPGALPLPEGESVTDGEWVLAIFEIGSKKRATAAAARGVRAAGDPHLEFERRDWDRIVQFVAARSMRPMGGPVSTRIPVSGVADTEPAPSSSSPAGLESSRVPFDGRVLLLDGDPYSRVREMLGEVGLAVETVESAALATEKLRDMAFDALVIDYKTPDDPLGFVKRVRQDPMRASLPVLLLADAPSSRDVVAMFASGADDFMPKPFRAPELGARIFGLLRRARLPMVGGRG